MSRLCWTLIFAIASGSIAIAAGTYLTDAIKQPAYLRALTKLLNASPRLPPWTRQVLKTSGDYVGVPVAYATIGGTKYELFNTCKPHDCGDNQLEIMFSSGGAQAWGAVRVDGGPVSYLGAPSPAQQAALKAPLQ
jgi:hypothetical protein